MVPDLAQSHKDKPRIPLAQHAYSNFFFQTKASDRWPCKWKKAIGVAKVMQMEQLLSCACLDTSWYIFGMQVWASFKASLRDAASD
jgi:hypothetical protein